MDAALCVDHHLLNAGASIDALPAGLVQPYFAQNVEPEALYRWIETAPSASAVTTVVGSTPLRSIPAPSWELYAANASTADATALWVAGVDARERLTRLEALASHGVEQPARERAARWLLTAPNSSRRMEALRFFSTLPPDAGTAAAVLPALIEWVNAG